MIHAFVYFNSINDKMQIIGLFETESEGAQKTLEYILNLEPGYKVLKDDTKDALVHTYNDLSLFLQTNQESDCYGGSPGWRVIYNKYDNNTLNKIDM